MPVFGADVEISTTLSGSHEQATTANVELKPGLQFMNRLA
jgi:hypothetical protein